ncbi:MAG: hypothetical protein R3Y45_03740 [Bacillota bacterium]
MKKKITIAFLLVLIITMTIPQTVLANMAAPETADVGTTITFQQNDEISVLSEVLDITLELGKANIVATYTMKNATNSAVSTQSMFLSPNVESAGVAVVIDGEMVSIEVDSYNLDWVNDVTTSDWQFALLNPSTAADNDEARRVDSILFEIDFEAGETKEIVVSYDYILGGYPTNTSVVNYGTLEYFLTPANMWADFENLTINLTLGKDMPKLDYSNLDFKKVGTRQYQYTSTALPTEDLEIKVTENWYQSIWSTVTSPYFPMTVLMVAGIFSPVIIIGIIVIVVIVKKKKKQQQKNQTGEFD